jgi:hypothetical protein
MAKNTESPKQEGPSLEAFHALQEQLRKTNEMVAHLANQNEQLQRAVDGGVLPEDERPMYELTQPYMSPDDVYYPEGVQFVDVTGTIVPNEFMIPLNAPAQERYTEYMNSLPAPGRQPTLTDVIDASIKAAGQLGGNASRDELATLMASMLIQGRLGKSDPAMNEPAHLRQRPSANVPLMPNTHIVQQGSVPQRPGAIARGAVRTQQVGVAKDPTANVTGGVATPPLSHLPA